MCVDGEAESKGEPGCQTLDLWGAPRVLPCPGRDIPFIQTLKKFEETSDDGCAMAYRLIVSEGMGEDCAAMQWLL